MKQNEKCPICQLDKKECIAKDELICGNQRETKMGGLQKKYGVVIETNLQTGECSLARLDEGQGAVAIFNTKEEAQKWLDSGLDIDTSCFDCQIIEVN